MSPPLSTLQTSSPDEREVKEKLSKLIADMLVFLHEEKKNNYELFSGIDKLFDTYEMNIKLIYSSHQTDQKSHELDPDPDH